MLAHPLGYRAVLRLQNMTGVMDIHYLLDSNRRELSKFATWSSARFLGESVQLDEKIAKNAIPTDGRG